MDFCASIQQHTITNPCTILDTSILQYYTAAANLGVWTNIRTRRDNVRKSIAKFLGVFIYLCPEPVVADANHQQVVVLPQLRQIGNTTYNRDAAYFSINSLSIINKCTVILQHYLFSHHASKTTSTDQQ